MKDFRMTNGVIFSDESGHDGANNIGAICAISGRRETLLKLHNELKKVLEKYKRSEIKFHDVTGVDKLVLGKEFINIGLNYIALRKIRVHITVWDKTDSRHQIPGRDDIANLCIMYYHTIKQIHKDWNGIENWLFYPDHQSEIEWEEDLVKYLKNTPKYKTPNLFDINNNLVDFPNYLRTEGKDSKEMMVIQLADLFAGIVRTSRDKSKEYESFTYKIPEQYSLFFSESPKISRNLKPKLQLMKYFKDSADKKSLGVNFTMNKYFTVFNKKQNLFILHYEPQGNYDKAPVKK